MRLIFTLLFFVLTPVFASGNDSIPLLLLDKDVQIESTEGINSMYNFEFERADAQFRWLKKKYPWHPLPYFLLGLSQWWRIVPNIEITQYDASMMMYMDSSILLAEHIFNQGSTVEGGFFLSASYAFKGRLLAERHAWRKAASAGKSAMKYLEYCRNHDEFGSEILFGDALYNYYAVWIPENYPILKPIMLFFKDGDKALGLKQLKEVANNAFFTRTEAQYFLMRIMANEEDNRQQALFISDYLHNIYPDNPYFHRFYARMLYANGQYRKAEKESLSILHKIETGFVGYEQNSGRYASFFLGEIYKGHGEVEKAKNSYALCIQFGDEIGAQDKGYYQYSLLSLGDFEMEEGHNEAAKEHYKRVKKIADRRDRTYKIARERLKEMKQ